MQWPEILLLLTMLAAALSMLMASWARHRWQLLILALVLGAGVGWYRVAPWQLVPLVLAWVVLAVAAQGSADKGEPVCAGVALALISSSAGLLMVLPFFSLPQPTGQYAVGTRIVALNDLSRALDGAPRSYANIKQSYRELVVQVWYPAEAGSGGLPEQYVRVAEVKPIFAYEAGVRTNSIAAAPIASQGGQFPVLIYGHSWGMRRTVDTYLCEELASHGYVVVALDHPLNTARELLPGGTVIRSTRASALSDPDRTGTQATMKIWADELAVWVADERFVLAQLAAVDAPPATLGTDPIMGGGSGDKAGLAELEWLAKRLDLSRVGAFGHSFGGAASFALLGQPAVAGVPVVRAAVNLDGWTFQGLDARTTEPILMVYAGDPFDPKAPPEQGVNGELDRADRAAVMGSLDRFGGELRYIPRTQHLDFTDQTLITPILHSPYTGPMHGERVRTITRGLLVGFFDGALKGSGQGLPNYPEVRAVPAPEGKK